MLKKNIKQYLVSLKQNLLSLNNSNESLVFNTKCVALKNEPFKARPTIVSINSNKTTFDQFTVNFNKCGESWTPFMMYMIKFRIQIK